MGRKWPCNIAKYETQIISNPQLQNIFMNDEVLLSMLILNILLVKSG